VRENYDPTVVPVQPQTFLVASSYLNSRRHRVRTEGELMSNCYGRLVSCMSRTSLPQFNKLVLSSAIYKKFLNVMKIRPQLFELLC